MGGRFVLKLMITVISFFILKNAGAQITPPGLGEGHTAGWLAAGVAQALDSLETRKLVTYVGYGRKSRPDDFNLVEKEALWVLNQEYQHHFRKHWQYSAALSYRRQHEYEKEPPFGETVPGIKQEFRLYGRLYYLLKGNRWKTAIVLRQELRKFFTTDFRNWPETFQARTRLKVHWAYSLSKNAVHKLSLGAETIFGIRKKSGEWSGFDYLETRLTTYYSLSPQKIPVDFNIGYMGNLLAGKPGAVHYLAMDIIWKNPFHFHRN